MRLVDMRPPFAGLANLSEGALASLPTPCYLLDEAQLCRNGEILLGVQQRTGCKILLAQKAFSNFDLYPLLAPCLAGTEASGLYESRLGKEELPEKENHVFCAAYRVDEFNELLDYADHIVFNSPAQLAKFGPAAKAAGKSVGLRINPERSTQEGHAIYDPCAPGSRLGTTRAQWDAALAKQPGLAALLDGLHFHTLCEQDADALAVTLDAVEEKFGDLLPGLKWLNFGGGHHITRPGYDLAALEACIARMQEKYSVQVYLEPGEAWALNAGYLVTTVLDTLQNGDTSLAILDMSAACHTPDVIEMPYRPPLLDVGEPGEKPCTWPSTPPARTTPSTECPCRPSGRWLRTAPAGSWCASATTTSKCGWVTAHKTKAIGCLGRWLFVYLSFFLASYSRKAVSASPDSG